MERKGSTVNIIYFKMNLYVLISLCFNMNTNEVCSSEGSSLMQFTQKGSIAIIIIALASILYAILQHSVFNTTLIVMINLCWTLILVEKNYQIMSEYQNECSSNIIAQQSIAYLHLSSHLWVIFVSCFHRSVMRIISLPMNALPIYLILVNKLTIDDNIQYLMFAAYIWIVLLGIPFNLFMSLNGAIKTPFQFHVLIGFMIQIPTLYLMYLSISELNAVQSIQKIYIALSITQMICTLLYLVFYQPLDVDKPFREIQQLKLVRHK